MWIRDGVILSGDHPGHIQLDQHSLGTILSTVFGWAVVALFGETSSTKKMWLSALVAAAAAWPILLIGVVAPKIAAFVLALVPMSHAVPGWVLRTVWIALIIVYIAWGSTYVAIRVMDETVQKAHHW